MDKLIVWTGVTIAALFAVFMLIIAITYVTLWLKDVINEKDSYERAYKIKMGLITGTAVIIILLLGTL